MFSLSTKLNRVLTLLDQMVFRLDELEKEAKEKVKFKEKHVHDTLEEGADDRLANKARKNAKKKEMGKRMLFSAAVSAVLLPTAGIYAVPRGNGAVNAGAVEEEMLKLEKEHQEKLKTTSTYLAMWKDKEKRLSIIKRDMQKYRNQLSKDENLQRALYQIVMEFTQFEDAKANTLFASQLLESAGMNEAVECLHGDNVFGQRDRWQFCVPMEFKRVITN